MCEIVVCLRKIFVYSSLMLRCARTNRRWRAGVSARPYTQPPRLQRHQRVSYSVQAPKKPIRILGIECSCDDTGVAVVSSDKRILSNVLLRQDEIHLMYKGIVPILAAKAHRERMDMAIERALNEAQLTFDQIDAIAFTRGPGLSGCLQVGLDTVRKLYTQHKLPILGINHMEGHALVARLAIDDIKIPFLALLVSGGHTMIVVCKGVGDYILLGETLDVALGECIDKVGREMQLEFKGGCGKLMEELATKGNPHAYKLPVPMSNSRSCHFSFSGLHTAAARLIGSDLNKFLTDKQAAADFAASFQHTAFMHIVEKVVLALQWCRINLPSVSQLVVSGGVGSNLYLREQLRKHAQQFGVSVYAPPPSLCTDNGVMIAWAGVENYFAGKSFVDDVYTIQYFTTWPLDPHRLHCIEEKPDVPVL